MNIRTKFMGELAVDEKDIITFNYGIPGFPQLHRFVIIPIEGNEYLYYLQAVDAAEVCFIIVPPITIVSNYDIDISNDAVKELEVEEPTDIVLYSILTIPGGDTKLITANLRAPIIINTKNNKGVQELLEDERYSLRYKIFGEE